MLHRAPTPLLGSCARRRSVGRSIADGSGAVQVTKNAVPESGASLSPDGAQVLFLSGSNARFESYYNGRLFVVPAAGGAPRIVVGENEPFAVDRAAWSKDGKSIYFVANLGVHAELFVVPAARRQTPSADRREARHRPVVDQRRPVGLRDHRCDERRRRLDARPPAPPRRRA